MLPFSRGKRKTRGLHKHTCTRVERPGVIVREAATPGCFWRGDTDDAVAAGVLRKEGRIIMDTFGIDTSVLLEMCAIKSNLRVAR